MAGLPAGKNLWFKGTQRSWLKLSMRSWSLAPLISTCFMAEPILASWMVVQLGGRLICHRWRPMTMGLCSMSRAIRRRSIMPFKRWWRPIIRNTHSKNHLSKSVYQNKPCNWRPRLVFLGIWIIWLKSRPAFIPKRWKSWGKPQVISYMRQTLSWMRKKKDCASLMVGIGYRFTWMINM